MTDELLHTLLGITQEAARVVMQVYHQPFGVDYKGPRDPVTTADRRANALICSRLADAFPDVRVIAEESDPASFAGFAAAERIFFVDPVDGTREFVSKNGEFVVMVGLLEGEHSTVGVVTAPVSGRTWYGRVGHGAHRLDPDGTATPIHVSAAADLDRARVVASRSHRSAAVDQALQALRSGRLDSLGSAGLKGAEVARGAADAYVAPFHAGMRWDACAVDALVTAAGGRVTDARGRPLDYRSPDLRNAQGLVASNGRIHETIVERLGERT